jgi:hypothetical protein
MREVGQLNPAGALFSTIVFGWCLRENRFRAFQISPCIAPSSVAIESREHDLEAHENLLVIGTCPDLLRDRIRRERPNYYPGASTPEEIALREIDLPKRALQSLIAERADPSVGGAIQYGWATRFGFAPASIMVPGAGMTVLGFTVNYVQVGSYVVSMVGRL